MAFYHGVSADEPRYDLNQDVVHGKLVPLEGGDDTMMDEKEADHAEVTNQKQ